jgi:hypothetical protein
VAFSQEQGSLCRQKLIDKKKPERPPIDACLEDCPAGTFFSFFLLTFHSFKTDNIIARPVGGMVAAPVELGDVNEAANPAWDLICSDRKDQHMVDQQLAHHGGQNFLSVKRKTELEEQSVRTKAKKGKSEKYQGHPKDNGYCQHALNGTAIPISW